MMYLVNVTFRERMFARLGVRLGSGVWGGGVVDVEMRIAADKNEGGSEVVGDGAAEEGRGEQRMFTGYWLVAGQEF